MERRAARLAFIVGIAGATAGAVSYVTSSAEITDLKLIAIEASQLKDISELYGEALPETPVFRVRFSTTKRSGRARERDRRLRDPEPRAGGRRLQSRPQDDELCARRLHAARFHARLRREGHIEGRGLGASDAIRRICLPLRRRAARMSEFVSSGLKEAPLCFALTGESRTGRALSTEPRSVTDGGARRSSPEFDG